MKPETLSLLCAPATHEPLRLEREPQVEILTGIQTQKSFRVLDGIPQFISAGQISGSNRKYRQLYNRMAPVYDMAIKIYAYLKSGGVEKRRAEYLSELEVKDDSRVLEVSVGTGLNLKYLPGTVECFGLDISPGMLRKCQKNLKRWQREAELFLGMAEELPFADESFDVVFHMGGINFFNDREKAINEMIRVAKPGTKIVIVDETEKVAKAWENVPGSGAFYRGRKESVSSPVALVPEGMREIKVKDICGGELYCLSFRKP